MDEINKLKKPIAEKFPDDKDAKHWFEAKKLIPFKSIENIENKVQVFDEISHPNKNLVSELFEWIDENNKWIPCTF